MSTTTTLVKPGRPFTLADRCDVAACGAAALFAAVWPGGSELLFCGHHGRETLAKIRGQHPDVLIVEKGNETV